MGLFGYNQKDYAKNTANFQKKIEDLRMLMLESGKEYFGVGKVLDNASRWLGTIDYPSGANGKELEAVDKRILGLLDTLSSDIQREKPELVMVHAKMLADAVMKSRKFGKERLSAEELKAEEIVAETLAGLKQEMKHKASVEARMKEIERESERLAEDDPEFDELDQEYSDLEAELNQIKRTIEVYRKRHHVNIGIINMRKDGRVYEELPPTLASERDLDREIAKVNELAAREDAYVENAGSALSDYNAGRDKAMSSGVSGESSLRAKRAAKEQERLASGIEDATVDDTDSQSGGLRGLRRNK